MMYDIQFSEFYQEKLRELEMVVFLKTSLKNP